MRLVADVEVGFDRTLRREWMDHVVRLVASGMPDAEIRREMRAYLEPELPGVDARRKVVTVMLRIWISPQDYVLTLRNAALLLWPRMSDRQRLALHWGLALAAYPFFREFALQAGRVTRLQEQFASQQMHRRMRERFGDRELVHRAGRHVLYTMVDWGAVVPGEANGVYHAGQRVLIEDAGLASWLIEAEVAGSDRGMLPLAAAVDSAALFPFRLLNTAEIRAVNNPRLEFSRQGLDEEMVGLSRVSGASSGQGVR